MGKYKTYPFYWKEYKSIYYKVYALRYVSELIGVNVKTLWRWVQDRVIPPCLFAGGRCYTKNQIEMMKKFKLLLGKYSPGFKLYAMDNWRDYVRDKKEISDYLYQHWDDMSQEESMGHEEWEQIHKNSAKTYVAGSQWTRFRNTKRGAKRSD